MPARITGLRSKGILNPVRLPIFRGLIVRLRKGTTQTSLRALGGEVFF